MSLPWLSWASEKQNHPIFTVSSSVMGGPRAEEIIKKSSESVTCRKGGRGPGRQHEDQAVCAMGRRRAAARTAPPCWGQWCVAGGNQPPALISPKCSCNHSSLPQAAREQKCQCIISPRTPVVTATTSPPQRYVALGSQPRRSAAGQLQVGSSWC